jgi:hypothetical protein
VATPAKLAMDGASGADWGSPNGMAVGKRVTLHRNLARARMGALMQSLVRPKARKCGAVRDLKK